VGHRSIIKESGEHGKSDRGEILKKIAIVLLLPLICLALVFFGCSRQSRDKQRPPAPIPVVVGATVKETVPVEITAIGTAAAFSAITVRSQVAGKIIEVHFKEGQDVKKGESLFKIDCRDLMATLRQAEANLARDVAISRNAEEDATRYKYLAEKGYVAKQQYDQARTNAESALAVVGADHALVENIKVRLDYCAISSPISGRTGGLLVDRGNLVKENDSALVTINQINPIYVGFTVPEKSLPEIKQHSTHKDLKVQAYIPNDPVPEEGMLTFVDNRVDNTTGTIALKAMFPNAKKRLWPGQFLNVVLRLTEQRAVLVPSRAVLTGQNGTYVFVVKPENTVEIKSVETSRMFRDSSIIEKGLEPGERVVLDGQLRLVQGARVSIKDTTGQPKDNTMKR
jgi:membrane fusion protein, multidrug efflux system